MKILVLHGSPKGQTSVTYQHIRYMQKMYPGYSWDIALVAHEQNSYAQGGARREGLRQRIQAADFILWSSPVYFFLVPAQYQLFIESMIEEEPELFRGKPTSLLLTSIHFFDDVAAKYLQQTVQRLNMDYRGFFSARPGDLLNAIKRSNFEKHLAHIFSQAPLNVTESKVLVIREQGETLDCKVEKIKAHHANAKVINLEDYHIKTGCVGCIQCGQKHQCPFQGKDDHHLLVQEILNHTVVYFVMKNSHEIFSAQWKFFFDRTYYKNHIPLFAKQIFSFVTENDPSDLLTRVLQAYCEFEHCVMTGVASSNEGIERLLQEEAKYLCHGDRPSETFLGIAGRKIFRDEIWAHLRVFYRADHLYFKKHGFYDFPRYRTRMRDAISVFLLRFPSFRKRYQKSIKQRMIRAYQALFGE